MLLAIVGHQDDVAVGGPDEAGELEVILGARRRRLHGGNLVRLDAAELRGRVQHPDAAQQTGVHLRKYERAHSHDQSWLVSLSQPVKGQNKVQSDVKQHVQ